MFTKRTKLIFIFYIILVAAGIYFGYSKYQNVLNKRLEAERAAQETEKQQKDNEQKMQQLVIDQQKPSITQGRK